MAIDSDPTATPEPYQSLYRRFRPQRFAELRGQEHVALALSHAVRDERVSHAYLFSGPRGTGKTSTARILAKALNCATPEDGEPCGHCQSCISITEGSSFDVHELDAASNNGVDAMRDLVARASLATPGRWKVYIVDEVHMLSAAASNALLKTLEEPPGHVVFVLATTDPHKVLPTIRSRTQHFEFHLLSEETLGELAEDISRAAALELPEGAVAAAVRRGRGSARDTLSTLEQVVAAGMVDGGSESLYDVIRAIAAFDSHRALVELDRAVRDGHDPQQLAVNLVDELRAGFLTLAGGSVGERALSAEERAAVDELGLVRCVRALEVIGTALVAMRESPEPRVTLEVAVIRLAHPEADTSVEALLERIERLERRIEGTSTSGGTPAALPSTGPAPSSTGPVASSTGPAPSIPAAPLIQPRPEEVVTPPPPAPAPAESTTTLPTVQPSTPGTRPTLGAFQRPAPKPQPAETKVPAAAAEAPPPTDPEPPTDEAAPTAAAPSRDELVLAWGDHVLQQLRPKVRAIFQAAHFVGSDADGGQLAVPNEAHLTHAAPLASEVADALGRHFGRPVKIRLVIDAGVTAAEDRDEAASPGTTPVKETSVPEDEEPFDEVEAAEDVGALPTAAVGIALAKDRLLQAFPGAEEVDRP